MKNIPFTQKQILNLIASGRETPFYIYDEESLRHNAREMKECFSWIKDYKNFFAVKALPNPSIVKILHEEGMGADCSSLGELVLSARAGLAGHEIMFTSNNTPVSDFKKAAELGAIINLDDISHIEYFEKNVGPLPELLSFRYNPGALKEGNEIIGEPKDAKFGITTDQITDAYALARKKGVKRFGLHTMVCSNETNADYFLETIDILFSLVVQIHKEQGIVFDFINIGGGLGIPYEPDQKKLDLQKVSSGMKDLYEKKIRSSGHPDVRIVTESGRYVTGPYGYLVTRVRHTKETYKKYIGTDACMANLMRPGMYGAYHHITNISNPDQLSQRYDVVGSLCENNDKFAIDRELPEASQDDILVIHDVGAHAHAMGFQYNAKLRSAEFVLKSDGSFALIRRAETLDDYFATIIG